MLSFKASTMVDLDELTDELEAALGSRPTLLRRGSEVLLEFGDGGTPDAIIAGQIVRDHRPSSIGQFDQLLEKARRVWRGEDTFTQAQAQKILAGLVIVVSRHLR